MAKLKNYEKIIKNILTKYANPVIYSKNRLHLQTIFDDIQKHYQLVSFGWQKQQRVHGCLIHIDMKGDKIWLQHDSTDLDVAQALIDNGISANHIVLAFLPESIRKHNGFSLS